jgi:hypothetical protein
MPTINETCEAVAQVLGTIDGLRALPYADDQINPPQAHVLTREFDPRMILGDSKRVYQLAVRVFVRRTDPRSAQRTLRDLMEPSGVDSVRGVIENEDNWIVAVDYAEVTLVGEPFEYEDANNTYWAVDFDVDVVW